MSPALPATRTLSIFTMMFFALIAVVLAYFPLANSNIQEPISEVSNDDSAVEPRLVHVADIRFEIGETSNGGNTPRGPHIYVPILGDYFKTVHPLPEGFGIKSNATEGLRAQILPGGNDYPFVYNNQLTEINVNAAAQGLNNPHVFRISSYGICEWNPLVIAMMTQAPDARSTEFGEVNTWQIFRINTDSPEYGWLNFAPLVAQEKLMYEKGRLAATRMKLYQFLVK